MRNLHIFRIAKEFASHPRYFTKSIPLLKIDPELVKKRITLFESELLLLQKQGKSSESQKVAQTIKDLIQNYILDGQLDNALTLTNEFFEIYSAMYGKKHLQLVDVYALTALTSFFSGMYTHAHDDYAHIIDIKESAKNVGVSVDGLEQDRTVLRFLEYFSENFQGLRFTSDEKKRLKIHDTTMTLMEIANAHPEDSRVNFALNFLKTKVSKLDVNAPMELNAKMDLYQQYLMVNRRMAAIYQTQHNFKEAISVLEGCLVIARELHGAFSPILGTIQGDLALDYYASNNYTLAEKNAKAATIIFSKIPEDKLIQNPDYEAKVADCCKLLGLIYAPMNEPEAERLFKIAARIYERIRGKQSNDWLFASYTTVSLMAGQGKTDLAGEILFGDIKNAVEKHYSNDASRIAEFIFHVGKFHVFTGQFKMAKEELQDACDKWKVSGKPLEYYNARLFYAGVFYESKEWEVCKQLCQKLIADMDAAGYVGPQKQSCLDMIENIDKNMDYTLNLEFDDMKKWREKIWMAWRRKILESGRTFDSEFQENAEYLLFVKKSLVENEEAREAYGTRTMSEREILHLIELLKEENPEGMTEQRIQMMRDELKSPAGHVEYNSTYELLKMKKNFEDPKAKEEYMEFLAMDAEANRIAEREGLKEAKEYTKEDIATILGERQDQIKKALADQGYVKKKK